MPKIGRTLEKQDLVIIGLLTALSTGILFYGVYPLGMGVEFDSIFYLNAAERMARGEALKLFNDRYYAAWPPLYPALIALSSRLSGEDPFHASLYLHVLLHGLLMALLGCLLFGHLQDRTIVILGYGCLAVSPVVFSFSSLAYSELPFVVATLPLFLSSGNPSPPKRIGTAVISGILGSLARYIGISLIISYALFFLKRKVTIRKIFMFGMLSSVPLGLWLLRNYLLIGSFAGSRSSSRTPILFNLKLFFRILADWSSAFSWEASGIVILLAVVLGLALMLKKERTYPAALEPVSIFMLIYSSFLLFTFFLIALPQIKDRFMFPLYVPFFVLAFIMLDHWSRRNRKLRPWIVIFLLCFLADKALASFTLIQQWRRDGRTVTTRLYHSPLASFLKAYVFDGPILSNKPHMVYFLSHKVSSFSPREPFRNEPPGLSRRRDTANGTSKFFLIWFKDSFGRAAPLEELKTRWSFLTIREFEKATVFEITPRGA